MAAKCQSQAVSKDVNLWVRRSAFPVSMQAIQSRLDAYEEWHNQYRPHSAHGTLTLVKAEQCAPSPGTVTYRQKGGRAQNKDAQTVCSW